MAAAAGGCARGPKTAQEAYTRLQEAVAAQDGERLFAALDLETRWSWMTIQRSQREAYDILLSNFPEGQERERQIKRFEAAATSESAQQLFARQVTPQVWQRLAAALKGSPPIKEADGQAQVAGADGTVLRFRRRPEKHAGWGFLGFADEAEQIKRRAVADLELIRASAADYERAAARQGR